MESYKLWLVITLAVFVVLLFGGWGWMVYLGKAPASGLVEAMGTALVFIGKDLMALIQNITGVTLPTPKGEKQNEK